MSPASKRNPYTALATPSRKRRVIQTAQSNALPFRSLSWPSLRQSVQRVRGQIDDVESLVGQTKKFLEACDHVLTTCESLSSHRRSSRRGASTKAHSLPQARRDEEEEKQKSPDKTETVGDLDIGAILELIQSPLFRSLLAGLGGKGKGE